MTANAFTEQERSAESGMDGHLSKPLDTSPRFMPQ